MLSMCLDLAIEVLAYLNYQVQAKNSQKLVVNQELELRHFLQLRNRGSLIIISIIIFIKTNMSSRGNKLEMI